jgi:hypothetical protein
MDDRTVQTNLALIQFLEAMVKAGAETGRADCATAASGTLLATGTLPADWMAAAAAGQKAKLGTWQLVGVAAGTIGYYRIYEASSPSICHEQGSVTATGGGGDMTVDNTNIAVTQAVTVTAYARTAGNA